MEVSGQNHTQNSSPAENIPATSKYEDGWALETVWAVLLKTKNLSHSGLEIGGPSCPLLDAVPPQFTYVRSSSLLLSLPVQITITLPSSPNHYYPPFQSKSLLRSLPIQITITFPSSPNHYYSNFHNLESEVVSPRFS